MVLLALLEAEFKRCHQIIKDVRNGLTLNVNSCPRQAKICKEISC